MAYASIMLASQLAQALGRSALAGHEVVRQLAFFAVILFYSLSVAAQALVAATLGEGNPKSTFEISSRLVELGLAFSLAQVRLSGPRRPESCTGLPPADSIDCPMREGERVCERLGSAERAWMRISGTESRWQLPDGASIFCFCF